MNLKKRIPAKNIKTNKPFFKKKKIVKKKDIKTGSLYVKCTYKNTLITLFHKNEKLLQVSTKSFQDSSNVKRKNNFYILNKIGQYLREQLNKLKIHKIKIYIKGVGLGRSIIFHNLSKKIVYIEDRTFLPFNGCRPPKQKRK